MSKKFTFLIVPDDDSETRSFRLSKIILRTLVVLPLLTFVALIIISTIYIPKISDYNNLSQKYETLVSERVKVLDLTKSLEKITHMDDFIRNSLGTELNFSNNPEVLDSILMVIPDDNLISLSDNIPSLAPIEGYVSKRMQSTFFSADKEHGGIDIVAKRGTSIQATSSGVVVFSGWTYEMGNLIIIYHGDDYMTHYGHNQNNLVSRLDIVNRGDVIGYVGNTGLSSGPHLHFEVWKGEKSIDPLIYFPEYLKNDLTLKTNE